MDNRDAARGETATLMEKVLYEVKKVVVGQDHFRIVSESARDGHALLFAAGKMTALPAQFVTQAHCFQ